ncbi:MAG TPA: HDIG domain-containing protein [Dissulfurispiraceae bacterium]|nr:HDIG domain-containing protein [Dissulfurispiraceae bacterium]
MPPLEKHVAISRQRTGKEYRELHTWIDDADSKIKAQRHDITRIFVFGKRIEKQYGQEGLNEYLQHIHDDVAAKFEHLQHDVEQMTADILAYLGVKKGSALNYSIQQTDIAIMKNAGLNDTDLAHCLKVADKAIEIAQRTGVRLDMELVGRGAFFHDLGKAKSHDMDHGKVGAELGIALGLPKALTDIMEKHIRGGMTETEAKELNLPVKDYTLNSLEEKIIIYADRMVDIITDGVVKIGSEREAEDRFEEFIRDVPKYHKNAVTYERYLGYHREIQSLIALTGC